MAQSAKDRWNSANYRQLKISAPPDVAESFKSACAANGVSMASVIVRFMREYAALGAAPGKPKADPTATRRLRRKGVRAAIAAISDILDAEIRYLERIPESFHGSDAHVDAERSVEAMEAAIDALEEIYL